jgi:RNA polymerase sigma-70 factor (ECF subfamily)
MMQAATLEIEETVMDLPVPHREEALARNELLACKDRVFCFCLGFVGNSADARDLAQETFARALAGLDRARPENLQAWIMRIARNACLDLARMKKTRGPQHPVGESAAVDRETPESRAGREEEIRIVRKAIQRLPLRLRDALVLREYAELSYQEIAQTLGIGRGTVMSRLNRARQAVLRFYREEHHGKAT